MTDVPDARLLELFARNGSEEAFAALVRRHIGLVHSVALRHTAQPQQAEDITQAVFIILARKAGSLGRRTVLPGWLYHTARLTAANWRRAEARRLRREQEAFMQSTLEESPTDTLWRELSPQLDEAIAGLGAAERDALVLRYFQNKSMAEVGESLGLAENTAQKRVGRALEKLRRFFVKRGVDSTAGHIADTISTHSVQAVPAALAKSITAVALAQGATTSISTLTLVKGALKIMAWTKAKTAIVGGVAILLVGGTTFVAVKEVRSTAEPSYDGKTLSVWLQAFQHGLNGSSEQARATAAVAHIGTNAIPTLLKLLKDHNSDSEKASAMYGFMILGRNGSAATPELIRLYQQHISESSKAYAARSLGMIGPAAEAAVPYLLDSVTNPDATDPRDLQCFSAVEALGQIHADPGTVVPALINLIHSKNAGVAIVTVEALGRFGPSAQEAVPALLQAATNYPFNRLRPVYTPSNAIKDIQGHYP